MGKFFIGIGLFAVFIFLVFAVCDKLQPDSNLREWLGVFAALCFYACGFFHYAFRHQNT
jgi:hypothetical protein